VANPYLSLLGVSTPEVFGRALTSAQVFNGLLGRVLVIEGRTGVPMRRDVVASPMPPVLEQLLGRIVALRRFEPANEAGASNPGQVRRVLRSPAAADALHALVLAADEALRQAAKESPHAALLVRTAEKAKRLAGLLAVLDSSDKPVVTVEHVEWAARLLAYSDATVMRFAAENVFDSEVQRNAETIRRVLKRRLADRKALEYRCRAPAERDLVLAGYVPHSIALKDSRLTAGDFRLAIDHATQTGDVLVGKAKDANLKGYKQP
jgi:hypothetical protein